MSRQRQEPIYKDFDLPTKHLPEGNHYVPPKTRDEAERDRLHELAHGTLILEQQHTGLSVASLVIKLVHKIDDIDFATQVLAPSGLNTSWYSFARGAESFVQRRRLKLPDMTALKPEHRRPSAEWRDEAAWLFANAAIAGREAARDLQIAEHNPRPYEQTRKKVGRISGKASLTLAAATLGDPIIEIGGLTQADTQNLVRQRSLVALDVARTASETYGTPPSIAQLADPYSDVSVFWHKNAPNGAMNALEQAWELSDVA